MNASPIRYRTSPRGNGLAATITICFGPSIRDTRTLHAFANPESQDDDATRADLRKQLASAIHHAVLNDEWD